MGFLSYFGKKGRTVKRAAEKPAAAEARSNEPYLTETVVFGMHLYRRPGDDSSVYFVDEARGIRKLLVDSEGRIQNFPGIVREEFWAKEISPNALQPQIRFRTEFRKRADRWIMRWQIQPDGRYWEDDDGFGAENDSEITLYTYVDGDGNFTGPFRIYEIGDRPFTLDRFEAALEQEYPEDLQRLKEGNLQTNYIQHPEDLLFPRLKGAPVGRRDWSYYTLWDKEEALAYWAHPVLCGNLVEAVKILLSAEKSAAEISGYPCRSAIQASMTLFYLVTGEPLFKTALDQLFGGEPEKFTADKLT